MCGIVGFTGKNPAAPILLNGLARLEYRGYDSAGVALVGKDGLLSYKKQGKLENLSNLINKGENNPETTGIGHTRWATHGKPSDENSHPHLSMNGTFALVHNGIIENYAEIKEDLIKDGYTFKSETDTEVAVNLLEKNFSGDTFEALAKTMAMIEGSFAFGIVRTDRPDELFAVRRSSPLIVGLSDEGNYIASDAPAILSYTRQIIRINDNEIVHMTPNGVEIFDTNKNKLEPIIKTIDWDVAAAEKGGYEHFMIKEIMEQPEVIRKTIEPRLDADNNINLDGLNFSQEQIKNFNKIMVVACGSAYHVGVVGKYVLEKLTRIPVTCEFASEFRYCDPIVDKNTLVIVISQSGETADTLAGLKEAKEKGATILSIVNVVGSSIACESDNVLYTWAGPEISVATTKAYSTQLTLIYLLAIQMSESLGLTSVEERVRLVTKIRELPEQISGILKMAPEIEELAKGYVNAEHAYFIGRNLDYAVALEASLKLKEISYIHSEAYAAGELKHGTISLIEEGTFVIGLACTERLVEKTVSNIQEVKARGAQVLLLKTDEVHLQEKQLKEIDFMLTIPATDELIMPSLEVIPLQLLGYYIAKARGCEIDQPRNLAKSVTVE